MSTPLSVLDLSPIPSGGTGSDALRNTIDLAQLSEELGYQRFWVAEHHNMRGLAGVAPEVLLAAIAQRTAHIRLGSGGILVPNYASLKVAEVFRALAALAPGRIDAGIGRAPNMDPRTVLALRGEHGDPKAADDIARLSDEIAGFGEVRPSAFPPEHPLHEVVASPEDVAFPPIWLLGSGQLSAQIAASRGYGYAAAYFFSPSESARAIHTYKTTFQPSAQFPQPHAIVTVGVISAEDEDHANALTRAAQLTTLRRLNGIKGGFATLSEAAAYTFTPEDEEKIRSFQPITGTPAQVRRAIERLVEQIDADEVMITVNIGDHTLRRRAYELLAEEFALTTTLLKP